MGTKKNAKHETTAPNNDRWAVQNSEEYDLRRQHHLR